MSAVAKKRDISAINDSEKAKRRDSPTAGNTEGAEIADVHPYTWRGRTKANFSPFYLDEDHRRKTMGVTRESNGKKVVRRTPREVAEKIAEVREDIAEHGPLVIEFSVPGDEPPSVVATTAICRHLGIDRFVLGGELGLDFKWPIGKSSILNKRSSTAESPILKKSVEIFRGKLKLLGLYGPQTTHWATGVLLEDAIAYCEAKGKPWPQTNAAGGANG